MEGKEEITKRSAKTLLSLIALVLAGAEQGTPLGLKNVCVIAVDNL